MIQAIYDRIGSGRVGHEYNAREFYDAFCSYAETKEPAYLAEIRRMVDQCPFECIVGNGYAPVLSIFSEQLPRCNVSLIHLRRANRDACIASLKRNAELFPAPYRYYVQNPEAITKRIAAFHFGDMTRPAWDAINVSDKMKWYYDKTHDLIDSSRSHFGKYLEINTEDLDLLSTREMLANFITGSNSEAPPSTHLNRHSIDMVEFPEETREKMQWMLGRCDLRRLAEDEVYAMEYFCNCFVTWSNHEIQNLLRTDASNHESKRDVAVMLERARAVILESYQRIEALQAIPELRDEGRPFATTMAIVDAKYLTEVARSMEIEAPLEAERLTAAARTREIEAALEAERLTAAARTREIEATLEAKRLAAAAAQSDIRKLKSTLSWRITAPLRVVRRLLNRAGVPIRRAGQSV
jgi:hypothetical protein